MTTTVQPQMLTGGPAFSAYQSSAQTLSSNTLTKLTFTTVNAAASTAYFQGFLARAA